MRNWINLITQNLVNESSNPHEGINEEYMGTHRITCDYGDTVDIELFKNPSKREMNNLMKYSEYSSIRGSLYPDDDELVVWVGDRVQHHDVDTVVHNGEKYYIRLFFDRTGLSRNPLDDEKLDQEEIDVIMKSKSIRRIMGSVFEIQN
jgi:hypothetical protein